MPRYHMHKKEREITAPEILAEILRRGKFAVLALCRGNEPYALTLSYGYDPASRVLYFHTAHQGRKWHFLEANSAVCATVIEDGGYVMGECAHNFRSVVLYGKISRVDSLEEKKIGMEVMLRHLEDDPETVRRRSLPDDRAYDRAAILKLSIEEMTGKAGR